MDMNIKTTPMPDQTMKPIIKDPTVFTGHYVPTTILHRAKEIKSLWLRINGPLIGRPIKNTIIYGLSGTGKTLTTRFVAEELQKKTSDVKVWYIRLKNAKSEYKALRKVGQEVLRQDFNGHTFTAMCGMIFKPLLMLPENNLVFIIDEIDSIESDSGYDAFLDTFLRPYENFDIGGKNISVIFISNKMSFPENLTVGTNSSFSCMDKIIFEPYDANDLRDILTERAQRGLFPGTYNDEIISLCAAYGAQEHGDARRTIELLYKSASIAEEDSDIIQEKHVRNALDVIEFEGISRLVETLPVQTKAVCLSISKAMKKKISGEIKDITTTAVYNQYTRIAEIIYLNVLTQRRISDYLVELSNLGIIQSFNKYKGRMGRERNIDLLVSPEIIEKVIYKDFRFQSLKPPIKQTTLTD